MQQWSVRPLLDLPSAAMDIDQLDEERQRNFYDSVRETIVRCSRSYPGRVITRTLFFSFFFFFFVADQICLLFALLLYLASCAIVEVFRKQHTREECYSGTVGLACR